MKIALIAPSNKLFMPYLQNYIKILDEYLVEYDVINWDRFKMEEIDKHSYRDIKTGHRRTFFDYYRYRKFIDRILMNNDYDKFIIFGVQLSFFLRKFLKNNNKDYIIDIRDYHKLAKLKGVSSVFKRAKFLVLSSPGYGNLFNGNYKYVINHNNNLTNLNRNISQSNENKNENKKIKISFIGATRDLEINLQLIKSLKNNEMFDIAYFGDGIVNENIYTYVKDENINNVELYGRYEKSVEEKLYEQSDLINALRFNDSINNHVALPNRLYDSAFYNKPLLVYEGTMLANIVTKYKLGLVINSFENIDEEICKYLDGWNINKFNQNTNLFLQDVIEENKKFKDEIINFVT